MTYLSFTFLNLSQNARLKLFGTSFKKYIKEILSLHLLFHNFKYIFRYHLYIYSIREIITSVNYSILINYLLIDSSLCEEKRVDPRMTPQ